MRPSLRPFARPDKISGYPRVPIMEGGHLATKNADWRTFCPEILLEKCTGCLRCYLLCPDGVISPTADGKVEIDFDFCKGCGVCAFECKFKAITMNKEAGR